MGEPAGGGDGVEVRGGGPDGEPGPADPAGEVVRDEADPLEDEVAVGDVVLGVFGGIGRSTRRSGRAGGSSERGDSVVVEAARAPADALAADSQGVDDAPVASRCCSVVSCCRGLEVGGGGAIVVVTSSECGADGGLPGLFLGPDPGRRPADDVDRLEVAPVRLRGQRVLHLPEHGHDGRGVARDDLDGGRGVDVHVRGLG